MPRGRMLAAAPQPLPFVSKCPILVRPRQWHAARQREAVIGPALKIFAPVHVIVRAREVVDGRHFAAGRENDMSTDAITPTTIAGIKRLAKRLKAEQGCSHSIALDRAAQQAGFHNFAHALKRLPQVSAPAHPHLSAQPILLDPPRNPRRSFQIETAARWRAALNHLDVANTTSTVRWTSRSDIIRALRPFMGENDNHGFYPTGGGNDFRSVGEAIERDCIEFATHEKIVKIMKPRSLTLELIAGDLSESFFILDLAPLAPSGVYAVEDLDDGADAHDETIEGIAKRLQMKEELVDLGGANYVERAVWDQGFVDDEDEPLPRNARLANRFFRGRVMIASKGGLWNATASTYRAPHNEMSNEAIRTSIELALSAT